MGANPRQGRQRWLCIVPPETDNSETPAGSETPRRYAGERLRAAAEFDVKAWRAKLESYSDVDFPDIERLPPLPPDDKLTFD
jgi:hypothetical protein